MSWQYNDTRWARKPTSFASAVLRLIGHLLGSAVVFATILLLAWVIGVAFHFLNSIYPFDIGEAGVIHKIQIGILFFDCGLSALVLFAGAKRFAKDVGALP
jgi:hypothetical protein